MGDVQYRFSDNAIWRRHGSTAWVNILTNVVYSQMISDQRSTVIAWQWDLELRSHAKLPQLKPLFTFIATSPKQKAQ